MSVDVRSGLEVRDGTFDAAIIRERNVYLSLDPHLGDCLLDVGGNIGAVADLFASHGTSVVTVEPEPGNCALLRRNVARWGDRVAVVEGAACAEAGVREFYVNTGTNSGLHSTIATRGRDVIHVNAYAFSDLLAMYQPTLVKVDIEGGEYELAPWLANLPPFVRGLAMELHLTRKGWRDDLAPQLVAQFAGWRCVREPKIGPKNWATVGVWLR